MVYPINFPYNQLRNFFFPTIIFPVNVFMTETASEILGKTRDSRRGRKVQSSEPGNYKKSIKKAKESWIDLQTYDLLQDIEDTVKKNNSKKAYQLVKTLTSTKQGQTNTIQDKNRNCPTETLDILKRWTEYCEELYRHTVEGNSEVLIVPPVRNTDNYPILPEEVEAAVKSLKKGKSPGIDTIPGELVQAGRDAVISALHKICNKIWQTRESPIQRKVTFNSAGTTAQLA